VRPKEANGLCWRPSVYRGVAKQGAVASMLDPITLQGSPALKMAWRIRHYATENTVAPAKPLWYLSQPLTVEADQAIRVV
jgi:hypothetical protein